MSMILSLNSVMGKHVDSLGDIKANALVIDPYDAADLIGENLQRLPDSQLSPGDFAKLSCGIKALRDRMALFLANGGLVVSLMRPYRALYHQRHSDLQIGNYDWLWPEAGRMPKLQIYAGESKFGELTEYGNNGPFGRYLQHSSLVTGVMAQGYFHVMAIDSQRKTLAFVLFCKKGRVVFLPRCRDRDGRGELLTAIDEALNEESWPPTGIVKEIKPEWLNDYRLPESEILENELIEAEKHIQGIEAQCERIYARLGQLRQLRNSLFASSAASMGSAIASIMSQWGMEAYPYGDIIEVVSGGKRAIMLPVVCDQQASFWMGKKLLRRLKSGEKGILAINAYRQENPATRPAEFCSPSLLQFAKEHQLSLVSIVDIFMAHDAGRKDFMDAIWQGVGIVPLMCFSKVPGNLSYGCLSSNCML